MRNDVSIPPPDSALIEATITADPGTKQVSTNPVPPPDSLKADVTLFDHPDLAPGGAGNFWLLGIIGLFILGAVILAIWFVHGLVK
jgi:hypothetical protein